MWSGEYDTTEKVMVQNVVPYFVSMVATQIITLPPSFVSYTLPPTDV